MAVSPDSVTVTVGQVTSAATIASTDRGATIVGTSQGVLYVFGDDLGEFPPLTVSQAGATIATHRREARYT